MSDPSSSAPLEPPHRGVAKPEQGHTKQGHASGNDPALELDVLQVKRNRWFQLLGASPFVGIGGLVLAWLINSNPLYLVPTVHLFILGVLTSLFMNRKNYSPRFVPTRLRIEDDALTIGERRFERSSIKNAYLAPGGDHTRVRIERGRLSSNLELRARDWRAGEQTLDAMGFGPDDQVSRFKGMSGIHAMGKLKAAGITVGLMMTIGMLGAAAAAIYPPLMMLAGLLFFIAFPMLQFSSTHIEIGADGLTTRWLNQTRFIPFASVAHIDQVERDWGNNTIYGVNIRLHTGEVVWIPIENKSWTKHMTSAMYARLYAALGRYQKRGPERAGMLVEQGSRSAAEWIEALRAQLELGGLRRAALNPERLWHLIESHGSSALDRAAAAVSLSGSLGDADRSRLRRIAGTVASPRLRIAIEQAADGAETEALAEALDALAEEQERTDRAG